MIERKIKLLIVDDSILFRETLAKFFNNDNLIEVVGKAADPYEARDKILSLRPDVLTLDIEMPKMNGIKFLKKLIPQYPIPVVVVSSAPIKAFDALDAGAVDYVRKTLMKGTGDMQAFAAELRNKVITASQAKVKKPQSVLPTISELAKLKHSDLKNVNSRTVVALGASTGGTEALQTILTAFPADFPPVIMVQHMPPGFTKMYAERVNKLCAMEVKEAQDGDRLKKGCAYLAPGDFQMRLQRDMNGYFLKIEKGEKVSGHCPSVDVLFSSVAKCAEGNAIGAIMTGMGSDGANGLLEMRQKGAYTIGQDKDSCVVYGMPMVAFKKGACVVQAPLNRISELICRQLSGR